MRCRPLSVRGSSSSRPCSIPKGLIFAVAVFPHDHPQLWAYAAAFAALVVACGFLWFSLGRGLAALTGPRAAILPRVAAIALLGFAAIVANSVAH
jgi:hypothetical protein